ncbi:hypothetical protein AC249_AIPGENE28182 [Exaiptasia diaphana]|nr:hypothetical protein AC249_AIPGENE28182 [Exaiptasia diaphana]
MRTEFTEEKPTIATILFSREDKRLCLYSLPRDYQRFNKVQFFDNYTQNIVTSSFSDCDILDKTICMTVYGVYNDAEVTINITSTTRSRYSRHSTNEHSTMGHMTEPITQVKKTD